MSEANVVQRRWRRRRLALTAVFVGVLMAGGLAMLVALDIAAANPDRHTIGHVGCKHGAHGPLWHAGHGKSFNYEPGLRPSRPGGP